SASLTRRSGPHEPAGERPDGPSLGVSGPQHVGLADPGPEPHRPQPRPACGTGDYSRGTTVVAMTPEPVLVLVPGASGAPHGGSAACDIADEGGLELLVPVLAGTRGVGVFEPIGVCDGARVNDGPLLARRYHSAGLVDLPEPD